MIFIGGVGPRRKKLDNHPRICSNCGLAQAYLVRMDDYLSFFFIPILRIRKGQPFVECERNLSFALTVARHFRPDAQSVQ